MSELKPCPFCLNEVKTLDFNTGKPIQVTHKGTDTCPFGTDFHTGYATWQSRPIEDELRAANEKLKKVNEGLRNWGNKLEGALAAGAARAIKDIEDTEDIALAKEARKEETVSLEKLKVQKALVDKVYKENKAWRAACPSLSMGKRFESSYKDKIDAMKIKLDKAKEALFLASRHDKVSGLPCTKIAKICLRALKKIKENADES